MAGRINSLTSANPIPD
uniref:Uncharacterized protein n=1 Tax=Arundo donax TaxID=35708 RepID=A0A0A9AA66_ARUDO